MFGGKEKKEEEKEEKLEEKELDNNERQTSGPDPAGQELNAAGDESKTASGPDGTCREDGAAPDGREEVPDENGQDPEMQAMVKENENLLAMLQRARADLDNFRRISRAEQEEARERGLAEFLKKLLPVLDNLERALQSARDEEVPVSHIEGLELIQSQLLGLLEQEGAVAMEVEGVPFDPNFHHAVLQAEEEDGVEPGIVLAELQKGYIYKKKVLRPAMVKVSRS